jgi:hypothetical protein
MLFAYGFLSKLQTLNHVFCVTKIILIISKFLRPKSKKKTRRNWGCSEKHKFIIIIIIIGFIVGTCAVKIAFELK